MKILDGRKSSQKLQAEIKEKVSEISSLHKRPPCLAVVLVGEDPASQVYVGHKVKACEKAGIGSMLINLKTSTTENEVLSQVKALNENPEVDAILVQLPLPKHIDSHKVMNS
ncbi:MAG: bifunctional methylenetetrahydrofolate dehydrogenase/methenyltetrahydrofolate cyclohydrolase, partial [Bdellovibrionales bacterium]|nr:bifunctional methylenetetrahydrofolate dehydrogenase/methenyltetrahydrofolate cyclohydrolase [Bdellovibrionales bacterium]